MGGQEGERSNIVPAEIDWAENDFSYQHEFPVEKPIAFSQRKEDDPPANFEIAVHDWNGSDAQSWVSKSTGRQIVQVQHASGQRFEIATSSDQSRLDLLIDGRYLITTWRRPDADATIRTASSPEPIFQRHRVRMMNRVYEDLNADGRFDGYHDHDGRGGTLVVGTDLVPVSQCDWNEGTARQTAEPSTEYRFAEGAWGAVE